MVCGGSVSCCGFTLRMSHSGKPVLRPEKAGNRRVSSKTPAQSLAGKEFGEGNQQRISGQFLAP
jgi:hypothetical protein